jgi:nicotinate-nucleotide adenylyltransferase
MNQQPAPKKAALFGGTFDPVHLGHLQIAEWVRNLLQLDKVVFVPNYIHPLRKRGNITSSDFRLQMLKAALQDFPSFEYDPVEIERGGISYTIDTLRYFHNLYPKSELFFLIGADNLTDFPKWKDPQGILELAKIVVYNRGTVEIPASLPSGRIILTDSPHINISSTEIRKRLAAGLSCDNMLPDAVLHFIEENQVYSSR